jgi:hypothetical protein
MTNICNQQSFFFLCFTYWISFFFLSGILLYTNLETFSYLPLMFLSNYINMQECVCEREKERNWHYLCALQSLSLSIFILSVFIWYWYPFHYMCANERDRVKEKRKFHDKLFFSLSLSSSILKFITLKLQNKIEHVDLFLSLFFLCC